MSTKLSSLPDALTLPVTGEEISAVCKELGLRELDASRRDFIRNLESTDVSACPGSGKTTLILAKLQILARRWDEPNRGICLLSHTNVAKDEIARRFGSTGGQIDDSGRPHFVGTIHAFLNRFLATPYLLSQGIVPRIVDSEVAKAVFISNLMRHEDFRTLQVSISRKYSQLSDIALTSADLKRPFGENLLSIGGPQSKSYKCASEALVATIASGYIGYDDVLIFAEEYLKVNPWVTQALRHRFPFVFIDEMQDTTNIQNRILDMIFPSGNSDSVIQRIGDPNQTIFGHEEEIPSTFPREGSLSIDSSLRVSSEIARIASPLALTKIGDNGLQGVDRSAEITGSGLYIITFTDADDIELVLPTFGAILRSSLNPSVLNSGDFCAVGNVHKERISEESNPAHFPRTVGEYHPAYKYSQRKSVPLPQSLRDAAIVARETLVSTGMVADGLTALLRSIRRAVVRGGHSLSSNRPAELIVSLSTLASSSPGNLQSNLCEVLFCEAGALEDALTSLQELLAVIPAKTNNSSWRKYLTDKASFDIPRPQVNLSQSQTSAYFQAEGVTVRVGSVHSVKGETHTATLLLDTFNRARHIEKILPWLTGSRQHVDAKCKVEDLKRLATGFVAMTRATHVFAIAVANQKLGETDRTRLANRQSMEAYGWEFVDVSGARQGD